MSRVALLSGGGVRRRRVPLHLLPSPPPRLSLAHCGMSGKSYLDVACTGGLNTSRLRETDYRIAFNISAVVARRGDDLRLCVSANTTSAEPAAVKYARQKATDDDPRTVMHTRRVCTEYNFYTDLNTNWRGERVDRTLCTFHGEQTESQEH